MGMQGEVERLVEAAGTVTAGSPNEANLRHGLENALEVACRAIGAPWTPFRLDLALRSSGKNIRFADVAHGAVLIEYEASRSFRGREGRQLQHARHQAEEYAEYLAPHEGRPLPAYQLVVWDGSHIAFGRHTSSGPQWDPLEVFEVAAATRLLILLRDQGSPVISAALLTAYFGPETDLGIALLPRLYEAAVAASNSPDTTRTELLLTEWKRLVSQALGVHTDNLRQLAARLSTPSVDYSTDPECWLFALSTQVALVAKLVTALALPGAAEDVTDGSVPLQARLKRLEDGDLYTDVGVAGLLDGDFFSWYLDDVAWPQFEPYIEQLVGTAATIDFTPTGGHQFARDLFKGIYEEFIPSEVRHSLGEYNTPDWLAERVVTLSGWHVGQSLTDPTCGTGTFLIEALRRRAAAPEYEAADALTLLNGVTGFDINPLAVLAARASIVVFLSRSGLLDPRRPCRIPVYLTDTLNPARSEEGLVRHVIQTERGDLTFAVPAQLAQPELLSAFFESVRRQIASGAPAESALDWALEGNPGLPSLTASDREVLLATVAALLELHSQGWDGIWSTLLAQRFSAAAVAPANVVVGNAPWVKWSNLPSEYASFIKEHCADLGLLSDARWVGGIESDICTLIFFRASEWCLAAGGTIAMLLTGTVFTTESAQGFRRFSPGDAPLKVTEVEDYQELAPFDGVTNHPTAIVARDGEPTTYPVPYRVCRAPRGERGRRYPDEATFLRSTSRDALAAMPVPGTDGGPWLRGTPDALEAWSKLYARYDPHAEPQYEGRKGVTTDLNGVFFVTPTGPGTPLTPITNDPGLGRKQLPRVRAQVESEHLFPLLRGRDVAMFNAVPDDDIRILMPQRGMHGDPELPGTAPATHRYLLQFKDLLEQRSSYRRFQKGRPWWSTWSTGPYTFTDWKVVWREFHGGQFAAAAVGPRQVGDTTKPVIPDHKVYFVPCAGEEEAHYLTGILNAPTVRSAISSYGAVLSLGVSPIEYLNPPRWDQGNHSAQSVTQMAARLHLQEPAPHDLVDLDDLVGQLLGYR